MSEPNTRYEFESVDCNLCHSNNYETISTKGKFGLPTNVVICKNCGLSYLNPRWNKESYLRFYQNDYDNYYRPKIDKVGQNAQSADNPIEIRLDNLGLLPQDVNHILEIGSGEGINLFHFKSRYKSSKIYAIEPSLKSQEILKTHGAVILGSDVDSSWDDQFVDKFDLIIMRHVLEHFMDPVHIMKKVKRVLKPSGIAYIAVPNNLKPNQGLENSWFRNVHTYYFNKYSLENLNSIVGMETLAMVEGDKYNTAEVYMVIRKGSTPTKPTFSAEHYHEQAELLRHKLALELRTSYKISEFGKKVARKLVEAIKP